MAERFDPEVERMLLAAGWRPGREVARMVSKWESRLAPTEGAMPEVARKVLTEFGGLSVGQWGVGEYRGRGSVEFDPVKALGESDRGPVLGQRVYPLGETDFGHGFLFAVETVGIWSWSIDHTFRQLGRDIGEALNCQLLGRRPLQEIPATGIAGEAEPSSDIPER